jgi:hypothetical protein
MPASYVDSTYAAPTGPVITVPAGGNLQSAINAASLNSTIVLAAGATYAGNFTLPAKSGSGWIYIVSSGALPSPGTRATGADASAMARVLGGNGLPAFQAPNTAHHYRLVGLEISVPAGEDNYDIVRFGGSPTSAGQLAHDLVIDRCWIHGNGPDNVKNGVVLNCGAAAIIDSTIENIHAESGVSTFESHAIAGTTGPGPFKIVNNFLEASHITILFGGATASIPGAVPGDMEIRRNHMTKRLSWWPAHASFAGTTWGVKNLFELKNARRVWLDGNLLENCWPSDPAVAGGPQHGWAVLLTVRDEGGAMPWAVVEDVTITNNIIRHANAGFSLYGSEGAGAHRIRIANNVLDDIGGSWGANDKTGRICQGTDTTDVVFDHNTMFHTFNNIIFAYGGGLSPLAFTNNITENGAGFAGVSTGGFAANVLVGGPGAPASMSGVGFVDLAGGNYRLAPSSPYNDAATDGTDIGCDIDALEAAIGGAAPPPAPPPPPGGGSGSGGGGGGCGCTGWEALVVLALYGARKSIV